MAPRPSPLHLQAAIALSEMARPRADIGIQTDLSDQGSRMVGRTSCSTSPGRACRRKVCVETQTRGGAKTTVQVQTLGEFTLKAKKRLLQEDYLSQVRMCLPATGFPIAMYFVCRIGF